MESSASMEPREPDTQLPSCMGCRTRKLKCSRNTPSCTNCMRFDLSCVYDSRRAKPGLKRGTVEKLNKRIESLERKLSDRDTSGLRDSPPQASTGFETLSQSSRGVSALAALTAEIQNLNSTVSGLTRLIPPASPVVVFREAPRESQGTLEARNPKRRRVQDTTASPITSGSYESWSPPIFNSVDRLNNLVDSYFLNVHPWIPMIHRTMFKKSLQSGNAVGSCQTILRGIFIAALPYLEDNAACTDDTQDQVERAADQIVLTANKSLSVENLQAMTILAFTYMGNGELSKVWPIIASLTRTVELLDLCREAEDKSQMQGFLRPDPLPSPGSWVEEEERRRVFWNIFILDRICSITTGWALGLTAANVHRRLPICGTFWNDSIPRVAPFFGIWDKSAADISNSVAFQPTTHHGSPSQPAELNGNEPGGSPESRNSHKNNTDARTIGAFAYFVESLESLCRINMYFLRQQIDFSNRQEVSSWLMRFKELDLRLVHWKMFLPPKWKDPSVPPPETANILDPNMSLAHVTHNTSMILLHQQIGYPEPPLRSLKLPNLCSAETCLSAATETANITKNYLARSSTCKALSPHWAFCAFVAAKILLVHSWFYSTKLSPQYRQLFNCLQEMEDRWNSNRVAGLRLSLAGQFANELQRLQGAYQADPTFTLQVVSPVGGLQEGGGLWYSSVAPSSYASLPGEGDSGDSTITNQYSSYVHKGPVNDAVRNTMEGGPVDWKSPSATSDSRMSTRSRAADDLSAIVASLAGEEFMEMDRVISLADFNLEAIGVSDFADISELGQAEPGWPAGV